MERLRSQLEFVLAIDRLKTVERRTLLTDRSRRENSAEHSWHIALMAFLLAEHGPPGLDAPRAVRMLLVHDIVEVEAGDTFCYDEAATVGKEEREAAAARRLFGILPTDQASELLELWQEFEARETPTARFANALDRLQPLLSNAATEGGSWIEHGVRREQVVNRVSCIRDGSDALWAHAEALIDDAARRGWLA